MANRMHTTPLLLDQEEAVLLNRIPFEERSFNESWLQELLFKYPSLIPVTEIEPVFGPLIPVARELSTPTGPLDILYVNPDGYLTLVETKLWRNPEARRVVVAQAIDYATQVSKWSYDALVKNIRSARGDCGDKDPFSEIVRTQAEDWDQPRFTDTMLRNLRRGRMLLLIVGDGIHESVEEMAGLLASSPQLGFTLALVEMALFRPPEKTGPLIVQPRIIARTREVVRAIVEVRGDLKPEQIEVRLPSEGTSAQSGRNRISQEAFLEKLAEVLSPAQMAELRDFLAGLEAIGIEVVPRQSSLSLHYVNPSFDGRFSFGFLTTDGCVDMHYVLHRLTSKGLQEEIGREYLDAVASLVPGAEVVIRERKTKRKAAVRVGSRHVSLTELLPRRLEWTEAIEKMVHRIEQAGEDSDQAG